MLRRPHLAGRDFTDWPQTGLTDCVRVQCGWERPGLHEAADGLPHPETQAEAEVANIRISSAEMMLVRRTRFLDARTLARLYGK
jgi:hypothetical protein